MGATPEKQYLSRRTLGRRALALVGVNVLLGLRYGPSTAEAEEPPSPTRGSIEQEFGIELLTGPEAFQRAGREFPKAFADSPREFTAVQLEILKGYLANVPPHLLAEKEGRKFGVVLYIQDLTGDVAPSFLPHHVYLNYAKLGFDLFVRLAVQTAMPKTVVWEPHPFIPNVNLPDPKIDSPWFDQLKEVLESQPKDMFVFVGDLAQDYTLGNNYFMEKYGQTNPNTVGRLYNFVKNVIFGGEKEY